MESRNFQQEVIKQIILNSKNINGDSNNFSPYCLQELLNIFLNLIVFLYNEDRIDSVIDLLIKTLDTSREELKKNRKELNLSEKTS